MAGRGRPSLTISKPIVCDSYLEILSCKLCGRQFCAGEPLWLRTFFRSGYLRLALSHYDCRETDGLMALEDSVEDLPKGMVKFKVSKEEDCPIQPHKETSNEVKFE